MDTQEGWVSGVIQRDVREAQMNSRIVGLCVRSGHLPHLQGCKETQATGGPDEFGVWVVSGLDPHAF